MSSFLITGATGNTGGQIAEALLAKGHSVSVGVRNPDKASALAKKGAKVVVYDYAKPDTIKSAFAGIDAIYLLTPFQPDSAELGQQAIDAAKAAGVKFILRMSAIGARADSDFWPSANHGKIDAATAASGVPYAILQPTFFMDNVINYTGGSIQSQGTWYGASAGKAVSYISTKDIADVAVAILENFADHDGKTYVMTGPAAITDAEVAKLWSAATGKELTFTDLPPEQMKQGLMSAGFPEIMADAFVTFEGIKSQGYAAEVSPIVEQVLGRRGETYAEFVDRNKARLS